MASKKKTVTKAPVARKKAPAARVATKPAAKAAAPLLKPKGRPPKRAPDGTVDAVEYLQWLNGGPLTFGQMINSIRVCDELSLEGMSQKLGITRGNLCDVEHGRRTVSPARAAAWAKALGYSPEHFVALALQAELDTAGIKLRVSVEAA